MSTLSSSLSSSLLASLSSSLSASLSSSLSAAAAAAAAASASASYINNNHHSLFYSICHNIQGQFYRQLIYSVFIVSIPYEHNDIVLMHCQNYL